MSRISNSHAELRGAKNSRARGAWRKSLAIGATDLLVETGVLALFGAKLRRAYRAVESRRHSRDHAGQCSAISGNEYRPDACSFRRLAVIVRRRVARRHLARASRVSNTASMANDLHESGARGSEGVSRQRARSVLVIAQVALAVVLLAAAGLTLKSFRRAQQVPLGFNPRGVLTMRITEPSARYDSPEKIARFYDQLLEKVRVLPGVSAVANCSDPPFDSNEWDSSFHITGTPPDPPGQEPISEMNIVSPDYFRVLEMSIVTRTNFHRPRHRQPAARDDYR